MRRRDKQRRLFSAGRRTHAVRRFCATCLLCLVIGLELTLGGCGGGAATGTTTTPPSSVLSVPPTETVTTIPQASLRYANSFVEQVQGGYRLSATFSRGNVQHARPMQVDGFQMGSGCQLDDQTDAVEPFEFIFTNTTKGFSWGPEIDIAVQDYSTNLNDFFNNNEVEAEYPASGTAQCLTLSDSEAIDLDWSDVSPGETESFGGFFVVQNYYSPNQPSGEPSLLENTVISFQGIEPLPTLSSLSPGLHRFVGLASSAMEAFLPGQNDGCAYANSCG